ncbi:SRPBCC domain-containing protein [Yoonia sp.]|uniref:SRPBCC domain-containing protein n=1 Tax=Yoonia sp. TaxID=2212373 RepID=UPI002FD92159
MTDTTLSFTRELSVSADSVWRCWTEPALLVQWFAPRPVRTTDVVIETFPGGAFNTTMHIPDVPEPMTGTGCVLAAEPGRRFAFTNMMRKGFQPQDTSGEGQFPFTAEIVITPKDTGCTYAVAVRHLDAAGADQHKAMGFFEGWGIAADQLVEVAATL